MNEKGERGNEGRAKMFRDDIEKTSDKRASDKGAEMQERTGGVEYNEGTC